MQSPIRVITGPSVVLSVDHVDTDQIIPARFLKTTGKSGLGAQLFHDWRYAATGVPKDGFVLNRPEALGASVLVSGLNFGCGSSREHAPWALLDYGFRAIVAASFADIFKNNALKNGLVCAAVPPQFLARLAAHPFAHVTVNVEALTVSMLGGETARFELEPFARYCLVAGVDELEFLTRQIPDITRYEEARTWKH